MWPVKILSRLLVYKNILFVDTMLGQSYHLTVFLLFPGTDPGVAINFHIY